MNTTKVLRAFLSIDPSSIPPGTYAGKQSAYSVSFTASDGNSYTLHLDLGVRELNCLCTVVVRENGSIEVNS